MNRRAFLVAVVALSACHGAVVLPPAPAIVTPPIVAPATAGPRSAPPAPLATDVTVFLGVNVVPMDVERILSDMTVVVADGRIAAIGPAGSTPIPDGATVVDGRGRWLIPGLADMHAHMDTRAALVLCIAAGVTTVRNMWGTPLTLSWREAVRRGTLLGPTIVTAGPILDGDPPVWNGARVVEGPADAERAVEEQKRAGYDFVKVYNNLSAASYDAIVKAARRLGMPVAGHVPEHVTLAHALAMKQASVEHLTGWLVALQADDSPWLGTTLLILRRHLAARVDLRKLPALVARTLAAGTWNVPTLTVDTWFAPPDELARLRARRELRFMPPWRMASWSAVEAEGEHDAHQFALAAHAQSVLGTIVHALVAAGAPILVGTDAPNPFVVPGFAVHRELVNLVEVAHLTPFQALRAATRDASAYLGGLDDWGTVAVGRRADLVLVEGNPLVDIHNVARIAGVMVRGRWLDGGAIASRLLALRASFHKPADRFAGMPSLVDVAGGGAVVWQRDYEIDVAGGRGGSGATFGEERVARVRHPDGEEVLVAQAVTDAPDPSRTTLQLDPGKTGNGHAMVVERELPEGTSRIEVVRDRGRLLVTGATPWQPHISLAIKIDDDTVLGGPLLGAELAALSRLSHAPSPHVMQVALDPAFSLVDVHLGAERLHEAPPTVASRVDTTSAATAGLARYKLVARSRGERVGESVDIDAAGVVRRYAVAERAGLVEYRLVTDKAGP